ncbi:MAG: glycosyltransferase, partial [Kineosporiaceae bacterium]|nr:glycosyltransferase [Kineosporiaceae bacterium]
MDQQLTDPGDDVWFLEPDSADRLAVAVRPRSSADGITLLEGATPAHQHVQPADASSDSDHTPPAHTPPARFPSLRGRRVLVIGINYAPEPTGIAPYTTGVAEELARHAAQVTVLTGLPHYPSWSVPEHYRQGRRFTEPCRPGEPRVIRLRHHVPATQSALTRARYELTFLLHAWRAGRRLTPRPDLIVCATPALGGAVAAARLARALDVPCITIVQDLMAKAAGQSGIRGGGGVVQRA